MRKLTIVLVCSMFISACGSMNGIVIKEKSEYLGKGANGTKWVMKKFATMVTGGDSPGYTCDETVFLLLDTNDFVLDVRMDINSKKECFGEESLRKTIVGTVVPSAIQGAAFIGGMSVLRPARSGTRIDNNVEGGDSQATGGAGGSSHSIAGASSAANASAGASASSFQSQGQSQSQSQGQYQSSSNFNSNNNSNFNLISNSNSAESVTHGGAHHLNRSGGGDGSNPGGHGNSGGFNNPGR